MDANPPFNVVSGQRQLAVIMFTDAVSFSARMHEQEVATLHRIERDMEFMRRKSETHAGVVLKTTGDGLLIQFASAVQAVACALEIQRGFASRTEVPGAAALLRHRIGIHIGDVFASEGDLMGDGVNIAARLMGEAPPGGIVISGTVHEVVKNKLTLHVARLGPRQLKNIKEPVDVFRVLLEAPKLAAVNSSPPEASLPSAAESVPPAAVLTAGSRKPFWLLLVLVVVAATGWGLWRAKLAHERDLQQSQSAQAALDELLRKQSAPLESGDTAVGKEGAAGRRDFRSLVSAIPARSQTRADAAELIREAEVAVESLTAWLLPRLKSYTRQRPLAVRSDEFSLRTTLHVDVDDRLVFAAGGAMRPRAWSELSADQQAAIIVAALRDATPPAPAEVVHGAQAFAFLHGIPAMLSGL